MYFPVSKEFLEGRDPDQYEVLVWSQPRLIVTGRLSPATSDADVEMARRLLLSQGWDADRADYTLFDQRNHRPRRNRYKLVIAAVRESEGSDIPDAE